MVSDIERTYTKTVVVFQQKYVVIEIFMDFLEVKLNKIDKQLKFLSF